MKKLISCILALLLLSTAALAVPGDSCVVLGEELLVFVDEPRLADGGAHLDLVDGLRSGGKPQRLDTGGDSARRDEDDLVTRTAHFAELLHETPERHVVGTSRLRGDGMGADLYNNSHMKLDFVCIRILYHKRVPGQPAK